jgi:hypothetical protein
LMPVLPLPPYSLPPSLSLSLPLSLYIHNASTSTSTSSSCIPTTWRYHSFVCQSFVELSSFPHISLLINVCSIYPRLNLLSAGSTLA